jgi:hypothetical protein
MSDQEQGRIAQTGATAVWPCPADGRIHTCDCHVRLHANGAA